MPFDFMCPSIYAFAFSAAMQQTRAHSSRAEPLAADLRQLRRQVFAERDRLVELAPGFAAANLTLAKGHRPQANLISDDLGVGGDGTLASATHRPGKGALRRDALAGIEMIQTLADDGYPFVRLPDFDPQSSLSDARQHGFGF